MKEVYGHFRYMFPKDFQPLWDAPRMVRQNSFNRTVGGIQPREIEEFQRFYPLKGLQVNPLPVLHGGTYVCMGFTFGACGEFVYLSDVSDIPEDTMDTLRHCVADVLVVDALLKSCQSYSHFSLTQALELIKQLRPSRAFLIGMACEFDHEPDDAELAKLAHEGINVSLSYDGLCIDLTLSVAGDECASSDDETDEIECDLILNANGHA
eukprot:TRINITY_DN9488_c0_g1_i1.p1 TRINITY_DN9488_c0_g1~~TRINITY_DN9488_c0_g1_i1.p1  ORF type:complete len:209 (-),score=14.83 TRINITY_DN9488_c0_g1_i1:461-1087(-)